MFLCHMFIQLSFAEKEPKTHRTLCVIVLVLHMYQQSFFCREFFPTLPTFLFCCTSVIMVKAAFTLLKHLLTYWTFQNIWPSTQAFMNIVGSHTSHIFHTLLTFGTCCLSFTCLKVFLPAGYCGKGFPAYFACPLMCGYHCLEKVICNYITCYDAN